MAKRRWVAPARRGKRAGKLRQSAQEQMEAVLRTHASACTNLLADADTLRNFAQDALSLVEFPECRQWIARAASRRKRLSRRDAEAAVLSAYCQVITADYRRLYGAYERWIALRLRRTLRSRLEAVGVRLRDQELADLFLRPLARFYLESVRTLSCDANRLAVAADARDLPVKPFGWAPSSDDFDVCLSLLVVCQARGDFLSEAFKYSPLAHRLTSEVLGKIGIVERRVCDRCGKEFPDRAVGTGCPECHGLIGTDKVSYLYAEDRPETDLDALTGDPETNDPQRAVERDDSCGRAVKIATGRARELWRRTLRKDGRNACRSAVLLSLAGLDRVPRARALARPRNAWLKRVALAFYDGSLVGRSVEERARRLFRDLLPACETVGTSRLSVVNIRTIISRFKGELFDAI